MDTQNHDEKLRRSWTETALRGIEKVTPMVTLYIEDEQLVSYTVRHDLDMMYRLVIL